MARWLESQCRQYPGHQGLLIVTFHLAGTVRFASLVSFARGFCFIIKWRWPIFYVNNYRELHWHRIHTRARTQSFSLSFSLSFKLLFSLLFLLLLLSSRVFLAVSLRSPYAERQIDDTPAYAAERKAWLLRSLANRIVIVSTLDFTSHVHFSSSYSSRIVP